MPVPTFMANTHPMTRRMYRLERKYMPPEGPTGFLESELMRASARISWDYFNNGMGNNVSEAVAFIDAYHVPQATPEFLAAWKPVREAALFGRPVQSTDEMDARVTLVAAEIIGRLDDADRNGRLSPLPCDMFDMPYTELEWGGDN
jgi:hypothetical protein